MLVFFKLMKLFGLLGILIQILFQLFLFLRINFMNVLPPAEQANLHVNKIFSVLTTPLFWIFILISLVGFIGTKKFKNNLSL